MKRLRWVLWAAVALALAGGGFALWRTSPPAATKVRPIALGGPFTMLDHTGRTVTERDFAGRPLAVFFGFTHCPDVCPNTLGNLADLIEELGPSADRLAVLFVTVDPERDTPEVMAKYVTHFGERFVGLTGTPEQVAAMAAAWRVFYRRVASANGDYSMDHTASVFLMTPEGHWAGALDPHDTTPGVNLAKLGILLRARPSS